MRFEIFGVYTDQAKRFSLMKLKIERLFAVISLVTLLLTPIRASGATTQPIPVKIAIALEIGGVGDNSFNDAVVNAARAVQKKYKIADSYIRVVPTDGTPADRIFRLKFLAKAGYNLIIAIGGDYAPAIQKISVDYPDIQYAIVNSGLVASMNVSCLVFADAEAAFLAGVVAATSTLSGKVAFVSDSSQSQLDLYSSFKLGAYYGNKKVRTISVPFVDSAVDVSNAITNGSDVIYSTRVIDGEVLNLVGKANLKKHKVWLIAQSPDQYYAKLPMSKKNILVSLDKKVSHSILDVMELAITGGSILGIVDEEKSIYGKIYNFKNSGITLTYLNPVTATTKSAVSRAISDLKSGKVSTKG